MGQTGIDWINQYATAHPFIFAAACSGLSFFAKAFLFTADNAKKLVRISFARERAAMKKMGASDESIRTAMKEQADFITAAAQEAETEATTPSPSI
jgi:hypothetical protein